MRIYVVQNLDYSDYELLYVGTDIDKANEILTNYKSPKYTYGGIWLNGKEIEDYLKEFKGDYKMKIKVIEKYFDTLDITDGTIYEIKERREFVTSNGTLNIAIDIVDDSGDIQTLVNFDEVKYEYVG